MTQNETAAQSGFGCMEWLGHVNMGYFPNGTAGDLYEDEYCSRCIHQGGADGPGCPVMLAHILHNYKECNNEDSILHLLIPRDKEGWNQKCGMFVEAAKTHKGTLPEHLKEWGAKNGIVEVSYPSCMISLNKALELGDAFHDGAMTPEIKAKIKEARG